MENCVQCGERFPHVASRGRRRHYCSRACQARAYRTRVKARASPPSHQADAEASHHSPAQAGPDTGSSRAESGLSAPRIVAVAVRIADAHGLDALSMRQVAAELGVATMSLYHHVRGRDELVEQMVEVVFRGSLDTPRQGRERAIQPEVGHSLAWREELEAWTRREWRLLSRHRWLLRVITDFPPPMPPGLLADVERVLGALADAGLDPITAHQAFQCASGLVEGLALLQIGTGRADRRGLTDRWRTTEIPAALERIGAENHPLQSSLAASLDSALDVDRMFEFGLACLLDGIAQHLTNSVPGRSV